MAQLDRGTIQGVVTDQSGAVVPDAQVQVIEIATNSARDLATNDQGLYVAPNLPVGTYRVVVKKEGFSSVVREPILVRAQVQLRVDFAVKLGQVTETVSVNAEAPLLDVSATASATGLNTEFIHDLPLVVTALKRSIALYLNFLPGYTTGGAVSPRVNGSMPGDTETYIDGGPSAEFGHDRSKSEATGPFIEMVGEFSVVANSFNAEYGGNGSWFTNVTIRSGTNAVHGGIFDHFGNDKLNSRSFFQPKKTAYHQNEGGFNIGGPIFVPKLYDGRNKTFFFFGYGQTWSREGQSGTPITIPREDFRIGNFARYLNASGTVIPIYDPNTTTPDGKGSFVRTQFPGNIIPANRIDPVSSKIIPLLPPTDLPALQDNNYYSRASPDYAIHNAHAPVLKVDHNFSARQKVSLTYTQQYRMRYLAGPGGAGWAPQGKPSPLDYNTDQLVPSKSTRLNHDFVIRPNLLNHITVSYDRYHNREGNYTDGQGWATKLGLTGLPADTGVFPAVTFSGGSSSSIPMNRSFDETWHETRSEVNESLTWLHGKHTMKFGGLRGTDSPNRNLRPGGAGVYTFTNLLTSQPNGGSAFASSGSSFASFLLGAVGTANTTIPTTTGIRFRRFGLFAQDEWRVSKKLTVSYGLRWDHYSPFFEAQGKMSSFDPSLPNPGAGGRLGAMAFMGTGPGRIGKENFQDRWLKGFGPRLGLAYQVNPKTLVRMSGGIYYSSVANQATPNSGTSSADGFTTSPSFTSADTFTPLYNWGTASFPQNFRRPPVLDPSFLNGLAIQWIPREGDRLPQILSWTVGIQRELFRNFSLDVSYIGSHSTHLAMGASASAVNVVPASYLSLGNLLLQPITSAAAAAAGFTSPFPAFASQLGANTVAQSLKPYPQYTSVEMSNAKLPAGIARFNSLQIKATKRYSNGLTLLTFLTWSKSLTNVAGGNTRGSNDSGIQYPLDRALATAVDGIPVTFSFAWSYELPFFKGTALPMLKPVLGGWSIAGALRYSSGTALQFVASNNLAPLGYPNKLADYVGGQPVFLQSNPRDFDPAKDRYLNRSAFAQPAAFSIGNTSRATDWARGWTQKSESLSLSKDIRITEAMRAELGADFINPFNFVRWGNPNTTITAATFGVVTSSSPGRTVQVNGRFRF